MAILSNRSIQLLLDEAAAWLSESQLAAIMGRLNKSFPQEALATEWELITLSGLSLIGRVQNEPRYGGNAILDFAYFDPETETSVVGEITTLSDDTSKRSVNAFSDALDAQLRKWGVHVKTEVEIATEVTQSGERVPRLPMLQEFPRYIFTEAFRNFALRRSPAETFVVNNEKAELSIRLRANSATSSIRHREISAPRDPARNVVYRRLRDKSSQFNNSGHRLGEGHRCVVLCDGSCSALHVRQNSEFPGLKAIIDAFFRKRDSLDVVLVIAVDEDLNRYSNTRNIRFSVRGFDKAGSGTGEHLARRLQDSLLRLPPPIRTPINARAYLERVRENGPFDVSMRSYVGWTWSNSTLEFSANSLWDYLTGKIDRDRFCRLVSPGVLRTLAEALESGGGIRAVELVQIPEYDDDRLRLKLGQFDARSANFRGADCRNAG
jgi:hypothetical protein